MTCKTPWLGGRPRRTVISVGANAQALVIYPPGQTPIKWPFADLRALPDQAGAEGMLLGRAGGDPARIEVGEVDAALIRSRAFHIGRRVATVKRGKLALLSTAAVASVALMIAVLVPFMANRLASYLPPAGEAALGEATLGQIRSILDETGLGLAVPFCEAPSGSAALERMTQTLVTTAPDLATRVTVFVLDHSMVNAFALPGGTSVVFRGLIEAAESAEELAAVLAHEIGHVQARDPTRIALQSAGSIGVLGLLFGDFAGRAIVLFLAERIITADYTQEAEAAADAYAAALLQDVGVSPGALASFFERLQALGREPPKIVQHFLSHPALDDRIAAARAIAPRVLPERPALTPNQWAALQAICN